MSNIHYAEAGQEIGLETYRRPFPGVLRIEPASVCNLACSHCPTGTVSMKRGVMKRDTFDAVMDEVRRHAAQLRAVVLYHGGEPLANKRFPAMLGAVKHAGVPFVKTVTNGMLLDDAACAAFIDHGLNLVEISLDGPTPVLNDAIRRKADHEIIIDRVLRLAESKRRRGVTHPEIRIVTVQFIEPERYAAGAYEPEGPAWIRHAVGEAASEINAYFAMRWPHMEVDPGLYDLYTPPGDDESGKHCEHVEETITIRANGDIVPCCYDLTSGLVMGNILDDDLETIWNGPAYLELRRSLAERRFNELCGSCNVVRKNVYLVLKER